MRRRTFLKEAASLVTAAAAASSALAKAQDGDLAGESSTGKKREPPYPLSIRFVGKGISEEEYGEGLRKAVEDVKGLSFLDEAADRGREKVILFKPAVNSGNPFPATTNPLCVANMIRLVKEKAPEARILVADSSGVLTPSSTLANLKKTGIHGASLRMGLEIAKLLNVEGAREKLDGKVNLDEDEEAAAIARKAGIEVVDLDAKPTKVVKPSAASHWPEGFSFPELLDEVTDIVWLPRASAHMNAGYTAAIKNSVGLLKRSDRWAFHWLFGKAPSMVEKIVELSLPVAEKIRLVVLDATKAQSNWGPDYGNKIEPGIVIASTDLVSADVAMLAMMKAEAESLGWWDRCGAISDRKIWDQAMVKKAVELGLGAAGAGEIEARIEGFPDEGYAKKLNGYLSEV